MTALGRSRECNISHFMPASGIYLLCFHCLTFIHWCVSVLLITVSPVPQWSSPSPNLRHQRRLYTKSKLSHHHLSSTLSPKSPVFKSKSSDCIMSGECYLWLISIILQNHCQLLFWSTTMTDVCNLMLFQSSCKYVFLSLYCRSKETFHVV